MLLRRASICQDIRDCPEETGLKMKIGAASARSIVLVSIILFSGKILSLPNVLGISSTGIAALWAFATGTGHHELTIILCTVCVRN